VLDLDRRKLSRYRRRLRTGHCDVDTAFPKLGRHRQNVSWNTTVDRLHHLQHAHAGAVDG
jgi:hypothetical protein